MDCMGIATENKRIVLDFYRLVVSAGQTELIPAFVSPAYHDHNAGAARPSGPAALIEHLDGIRRTFPDLTLTCHEAIAEGEWVAVRVTATGTHTGSWQGIRPTGKTIRLRGINLDRVVDGRIVEHYGEADTFAMLVQMGADPSGERRPELPGPAPPRSGEVAGVPQRHTTPGNITLIGMPGAGKSTIGIILAKNLSLGFIDTDVLIQINRQRSLQQLLDSGGHLHLRRIEEEEICKLNLSRHVIATGGSAAYSEKAMHHLGRSSHIVFLEVSFDELLRRIRNFQSRGIAKAPGQSFEELFAERQLLYRRYAGLTIHCDGIDQETVAERIATALPPGHSCGEKGRPS